MAKSKVTKKSKAKKKATKAAKATAEKKKVDEVENLFNKIVTLMETKDVTIYSKEMESELFLKKICTKNPDHKAFHCVEIETGNKCDASFNLAMPQFKNGEYCIRQYNIGSIDLKLKRLKK